MTQDASPSNANRRKQLAALASVGASLFLTVAKLSAGVLSGSLALISEGAHNSVDIAVSATTFFAVRVADKPADEEHPFGHAKIEAVAALAQTGFLIALALGVVYAASRRLIAGQIEVDANIWAFAVIVISLAVDTTRWRWLTRIARETRSDALAADAMHYSSDLVSSLCVLIGLAASKLGFVYGDALAAFGVAAFIAIAGYQLGRRTLNSLIDAAPKGLTSEVSAFLATAPGIVGVDFLRLRRSGAEIVGDLGVFVSRTLPIERVAVIKAELEAALVERWPDMALTITADPRALDNETVLERVLLTAARRRLFVHQVVIQQVGGRVSVTLDLEVDGQLSLGAAHAVASRLEDAIRGEIGDDVEVETHIEPLETRELAGREADPTLTTRFTDTLRRVAARDGRINDIHDVRLRVVDGGCFGIFHCRVPPTTSVATAHAVVDALERAALEAMPDLVRAIGHAEPLSGAPPH